MSHEGTPARVQRTAEEITDRKREEVRRRQERGQRELEGTNAKLWVAEHLKQS